MAYKMALPTHLRIHNCFHISLLRKYVYDSTHIIDWNVFLVELEGKFQVEPVHILDRKETVLQNRFVARVKVQWKHFSLEEVTWELEYAPRKKYPSMFPESMEDVSEHCGHYYFKGEKM